MPICKKNKKVPTKKTFDDRKLNSIYTVIEIEAWEKAAEIDVRTEEEYNAIRKDFVMMKCKNVDKEYHDKHLKTITETKKHNANVLATSRHEETVNKHEYINNIKMEIVRNIENDMKDKSRYSEVLKKLILEGLYKLLEPRVMIVCREQDKPIIQELFQAVQEEYTKRTSLPITLKISQRKNLPENCLGGINMIVKNERITLENTLESRLDKIMQNYLPTIKRSLFGQTTQAEIPNDAKPSTTDFDI